MSEERHREAADLCEEVYAASADPRAGLAAARARGSLGELSAVRDWAGRLAGTAQEATAWGLAARLHMQRGEPDAATAAFSRSLELQRAAGDHAEAAKSLYGLFYVAWDEGRHRQALLFAHQSAAEAAAAGDPALQWTAFGGIFTAHYELGDLDGAERAVEAARELSLPESRAYVFSYLGTLRLDQDRPALARDALEKVLEVATGHEDRRFFRSTHLNLVRANLELGDLDRARQHLQRAWEHAEPDGREQSALLSFQAQIEHRQGLYEEAAATLARAFEQEPHDNWRWQLEHQLGLAREALGDAAAAEAAYERAAATVESLYASLGFDGLKPWLLAKRRRAFEALYLLRVEAGRHREALATVERVKARTFLDAFVDAVSETPAAEPGDAAERAEALYELLPAIRESPATAPRPLDEVLAASRGRQVLIYFQAGDALWRIVVTDGRIAHQRLAVPAAEIAELAGRWLADPGDAGVAAELGDLLLPPEPLFRELLVAADRPLDGLPFAALRRRGRWLVEDHEIAYVPGLNALAALQEPRAGAPGRPVVLGDPRGDLEAADREAREVAARLGVTARTGDAADSRALAAAASARVLHLATHGGAGPAGPWLALADRELGAARVMDLSPAPRLVVLASCAGAARRRLGTWSSLGAAFLAAGSEQVLAALWSIEDQAAGRFVLRFYDEGGIDDAAGALARAQLAAIRAGQPASVWAPFVLLGVSSAGPAP